MPQPSRRTESDAASRSPEGALAPTGARNAEGGICLAAQVDPAFVLSETLAVPQPS
ncbi:hypothetical protein [Streptomyces sp. NPDC051662]|uniref:hypothetical protein n=1 Tax=Streptomyces sp. NPDC051662 TaxID=3154750 RepID=UPI003414B0C0